LALVIEKRETFFDLSQIGRGYLLWGKHRSWDSGRAGFVTSATENELVVQYHPGIGNVTNHFRIPVSEVMEGQWEIRWSADMADVKEHNIPAAEESADGLLPGESQKIINK